MTQLQVAKIDEAEESRPAIRDVVPTQYAGVIREMTRHEDDVTNHRLMWLLLVQGLTANAYVNGAPQGANGLWLLAPAGILVSLSAFLILYKSYHARGYLEFLGTLAKRGALQESRLPLIGWPRNRVAGWRSQVWICPWFRRAGDLLEPYLLIPAVLIVGWLVVLMRRWTSFDVFALLPVALLAGTGLLSAAAYLWVRIQSKFEVQP